jgi:hypothetical protein
VDHVCFARGEEGLIPLPFVWYFPRTRDVFNEIRRAMLGWFYRWRRSRFGETLGIMAGGLNLSGQLQMSATGVVRPGAKQYVPNGLNFGTMSIDPHPEASEIKASTVSIAHQVLEAMGGPSGEGGHSDAGVRRAGPKRGMLGYHHSGDRGLVGLQIAKVWRPDGWNRGRGPEMDKSVGICHSSASWRGYI